MRKQKGSETRILSIFDGFGSHLGPPKRSQDAQKSMLKLHQNLISFEGLLERDFFDPRGAKTRQRRRSPHKIESPGAQWGRIKEGEDRRSGSGSKNWHIRKS